MTTLTIDSLNSTFARRLIVAQLINSLPRPCVPELMRLTGWPRRTLQDIIKALPGLGLEVEFVQDGVRNNAGYYRLNGWGPFDPNWIEQHRFELYQLLELTLD
ncbi:MAG: helix-turn-helix domain-containing protein [Halopseudomonas sp.]